jgi:hypothetical protein
MLLNQIDSLTAQVNTLTARIGELLVTADPSEHDGGANLTAEPAPGSKLSTSNASRKSPASVRPGRKSSSPKSAWT